MDSKILFPLAAALCVAVMALAANSSADERVDDSSVPIIDLPAVTVKPEAADLAHHLAYRDTPIVTLEAMIVTPQDVVHFLSDVEAVPNAASSPFPEADAEWEG